MTDDLDLIFEREVCGHEPLKLMASQDGGESGALFESNPWHRRHYCTEPNNVLPWIEKWRAADPDYRTVSISLVDSGYRCELDHVDPLYPHSHCGKAVTIGRAIATALIRAKRAARNDLGTTE